MKNIKSEYIKKEVIEVVLFALTPPNRLACMVALHTGLRIDDVLSLRTDQLNCSRLKIIEKKTGKKKTVTIPDNMRYQLYQQSGEKYVFQHRKTAERHRTRQAVWADLKRASKAFRVPENLTPHSLRKVYAVRLFEKYGDMARVRKALNHDNDTVTAIYALADVLQTRSRKK